MKVCTKCGVEKDESEFNKDLRLASNLSSRCKLCKRSYYYNNKEKYLKTNATYLKTTKGKLIYDRSRREWVKNNSEKVSRKRGESVNVLCDWYVRSRLRRKGFTKDMSKNTDLIELQRLIIKTKRLCQKLQTSKS